MAPSKEDFLERKLLCLEKRLTLIERFVEARFSESLQDYATNTHPPPPKPSFSRPAPASVKRKASEQVVAPRFSPKITKIGSKNLDFKGIKDCVVQVTRLQLPVKDGKTRSSTMASKSAPSTSVEEIEGAASRTRRTRKLVVRDDFVTETKIWPRRGGRGDNDTVTPRAVNEDHDEETNLQDDDNEIAGDSDSLPSPATVDMVETYFEDDDPPEYQEEEEDTYFTFPGTSRPAKTESELRGSQGRLATNHVGGDDNEDGNQLQDEGEGDSSDKDWSGAENDGDEDWNVKKKQPKKKRAPSRSQLPDGTRPKGRKSFSLDSIRTDAIVVNDATLQECPTCHRHIKVELIALHIASHSKTRNFVCSVPNCGKNYFDDYALRKHERTHQPERWAKCRICSKLFVRKDNVLPHERLCVKRVAELGVQVDPAIIEDLTRRSKGTWKWVPPSTKGEAPVEEEGKQCPHCNLTFKTSSFDKHLRTHDARNWSCSLCNKSYSIKRTLVRHIEKHHGDAKPSTSATGQDESESDDGSVTVKNEVVDTVDVNNTDWDTENPSSELLDNLETPQG